MARVGTPEESGERKAQRRPEVPSTAALPAARLYRPLGARGAHITWPRWLRYPDLWLAVAIGAFLRLWHLDATLIGSDQVSYLTLAHEALRRGALPLTGLPYSIHLMSAPLDIYFSLPFVAVTPSPLPVVVSIALLNVAAIVACYVFTLRCFGRRTAAIAALLFATCGAAVDFSRFLWQLNYIPPLLAFWALTLEAGVHRGRKWLVPSVALLLMAALLHPTAALLLPALAVALVLAPRRPRWWEYVAAGAVAAVLVLPNIVWEALSGGADLSQLDHYAAGKTVIDPAVFYRLFELLGGPITPLQPEHAGSGLSYMLDLVLRSHTRTIFSPDAPYTALAPFSPLLALGATALFATGWVVLSARVFGPGRQVWRAALGRGSAATTATTATVGSREGWRRLAATWRSLAAAWRGARADVRWRMEALLWVCVTLPPALMLRHTGPLYRHYLLCLYPFVFITAAIGADWLLRAAASIHLPRIRTLPPGASFVRGAVLALLAVLLAGQGVLSLLATQSFASGALDLGPHPTNFTLAELQTADAALGALERRERARTVVVLTELGSQAPLTYELVGERPDRVSVDHDCLLIPAPRDQPALVAANDPHGAAARLLATLPGAAQVGSVPLAGTNPMAVYRLDEALPRLLPDETALDPLAFGSGGANDGGLRLEAAAVVGPDALRLRWEALGTTPAGATPAAGMVTLRLRAANGTSLAWTFTDCQPSAWHAGETVFTWLSFASLPRGETLTDLAAGRMPQARLAIQVLRYSQGVDVREAAGLRFVTGWQPPITYTAEPITPPAQPGSATGAQWQIGAGEAQLDPVALAHTLSDSLTAPAP